MRPAADRDVIEAEGTVADVNRGLVLVNATIEGQPITVSCTYSGRLRMNHIRCLPGDLVTIEISPYDTTKGRVTFRGRRDR